MYFARWKAWTIWIVTILSLLIAAPNLVSEATLQTLPSYIPARQVSLGLDLQGGSHLLLQVDLATVERDRMANMVDTIRGDLRRENINFSGIAQDGAQITLKLNDGVDRDAARRAIETAEPDLNVAIAADGVVTLTLKQAAIIAKRNAALQQSIEIIRRRVDETGTKEPRIQQQGTDRILVQLPGVREPDRIKALIGTTAKLTFRMVNTDASPLARPPVGSEVLPSERGEQAAAYVVNKRVMVSGENLVDAQPSFQDGQPVVSFRFDSVGSRRFGDATTENVGKPFAIVLDNKVISAPVIREPITGGRGIISGNFTTQSASDLSVLLRAGALPAPLKIIEERTVGPDLGADAIRAGLYSVLGGLVMIMIYMIVSYGTFGAFAVIALILNLIMTIAALSLLQATLTLPGIAGMLIAVGLAVDANILINERIREETKLGRSAIASIDSGFKRAFATIVDANLTTMIKMVLLYALGSGPIKGFAVTTSLGILTSMFTATVMVRYMIGLWYARNRPSKLPM
ncbi:MAG: protein translocase subunit SecD [Elstera sp.]